MLPSPPIVVILGCTGTGKSKLAIQLANKFNGEIISADSMQVYKGLDIVTNKVTTQEQKEAVHHCINFLHPLSRYTVVDFRNRAVPVIEKLLKQNKLPIIVGGTNYYIESLLWKVLVTSQETGNKLLFEVDGHHETDSSKIECNDELFDVKDLFKQKITQNSFQNIPNLILHQALQQIDPHMAKMTHPQDKRKVIRSLQIYQQCGCRHSDLLAQQRCQEGGSSMGGPLRYKKCVMLWLQCDMQVLGKRLDNRVDDMVKKGLINELLDFHKCYNEGRINSRNTCYTEGIFQSIGFKEFHQYLTLSEEERNSTTGQKSLNKAIEDMKIATRQYARKQVKWIVNRFLKKPDRQVPPVYGLDITNIQLWEENVLRPAIEIVQSVNQNIMPSVSPLPVQEGIEDVHETYYCETCERIFVGQRIWEIHLKSKKHQKKKASLRKKANSNHEELKRLHSLD